jgi:tRNA uracil 4-sulfurtransferase
MESRGILVHYAELGTKGFNKKTFVKRLIDDITRALGHVFIENDNGRLFVQAHHGELGEAALERMATIAGVANYAPAVRVDLDLEAMRRGALAMVQDRTYKTFRVRSRRVFKELRYSSKEIDYEVGGFLHEQKPALVQLKGAELELNIEMLPHGAYLFIGKRRGMGGLPVGTGGIVACLMSGGIDSPVAAFRMMRRGCRVVLIHFHSQPFQNSAASDKALELAERLSHFHGPLVLYRVPFGELQREIVTGCPPALRVVLYRRFMMRLAAVLAQREHAKALITGEALGQVASQTLSNMTVIDEASPMSVLRPLVGFDKQEIIDEARRIGTFDISIQPDQDCCTLFVPPHPETHARLDNVVLAEGRLEVTALCAELLARAERLEVAPRASAPVLMREVAL